MTISRRHLLGAMPALGAIPVLGLSGCADVPEAGPVIRVSQTPQQQRSPGVDIAPQPPRPDGSTDEILAGFLSAMATYQPNYVVARQYLSETAAKKWKPDAGVSVYDPDGHRPITTETSAVLSAPLIGRLDGVGRFQASIGTVNHDFGMVQQRGQWRIDNPPEGLLVARYLFGRYWTPQVIWFLSSDQSLLVPTLVRTPDAAVSASSALEALLAGPAAMLRPAIGSALPPEVRGGSVSVTDLAVAEVKLNASANVLSDSARLLAAAQLTTTLCELDYVRSVRVIVNGQPWQVLANSTATTFTAADFDSFQPVVDRPLPDAVVVRDKVVGRLAENAVPEFTPIAGAFGTSRWSDVAGSVDVGPDLGTVAVVNQARTRLWLSRPGVDGVHTRVNGRQLCRPQVEFNGTGWVIGVISGVAQVARISPSGTLTMAPIQGLPAGTITAFRIAPDRSRIAAVLSSGSTATLGILRLRAGESVVVDGWQPMPLTTTAGVMTVPVDVAWSEAVELLVLGGAAQDPRPTVHRVSLDGASVSALGPSAVDIDPVELAATPRRSGVTALVRDRAGQLWRYEDRYRWRPVFTRVTAVALPG